MGSGMGGTAGAGNGTASFSGVGPRGLLRPHGRGGGFDGTPPNGVFNAISKAEGTTRDGYDTLLGYGRWGRPDKPISTMTLDQVKAFGLKERMAQVASGMAWDRTSSANGKYQITGSTMMAAAKALGMDPASTVFNADTQNRMAAWILRKQGFGAWEGLKAHPDLLAAAKSALASGNMMGTASGPPATGADVGAAGRAVDNAMRLHGLGSAQAAKAFGSAMHPGEWCADFVNGALRSAGMKGVNSSIANSFLGWGHEVAATAAKKGDVLVEDRGRGFGNPGGHAGLFSGATRFKNGRLQMEMVSGNYGNRVNAHDWTDTDNLHVRRSDDADSDTPAQAAARSVIPATRGGVHHHHGNVTIAVNGAGDADAVARKVHRAMIDGMQHRVHDYAVG